MNLKQNKSWFFLAVATPLVLVSVVLAGAFFKPTVAKNTKSSGKQQSAITPMVLGAISPLRGEINKPEDRVWAKKNELDLTGITAKSFLVYDLQSGAVLAQKNSADKLAIASLTKLMTALVVYENLDFSQSLNIELKGRLNVQPILGLAVGDRVRISDLFNAMLVGSCNDAAKTLANQVEKTTNASFVSLMNEKAGSLGMKNTKFSNPLGFDSKSNYSTGSDLKLLVDHTQNLGVFVNLGKMPNYSFKAESGNLYRTEATNKLLANHSDIEAIKTGFTENAGGSIITKLSLSGRKLIIIVLGSKDREKDTLKLREHITDNFEYR